MRVALIYNPLSGSPHLARQRIVAAAAAIFRTNGHDVNLLPSQYKGHAISLAAEAAGTSDIILSAGGDGTVHEILQPLVQSRSQCALGVIPLGTANVLASDIGLPRDPLSATRALLHYAPRRIAAGRIEYRGSSGAPASRYFTVAAGVGGHARLIYDASAVAKRRGGMWTYYFTGFRSLFTHQFVPMRAMITAADGSQFERQIVEAFAMRVASFGGLLRRWRPGGALLSDELRLVLLTRADRIALFRYSLAAIAGRATEASGIEFHNATSVTCTTVAPEGIVHSQADGETLGTAPITLSIVPDAFTLLLPPDATSQNSSNPIP